MTEWLVNTFWKDMKCHVDLKAYLSVCIFLSHLHVWKEARSWIEFWLRQTQLKVSFTDTDLVLLIKLFFLLANCPWWIWEHTDKIILFLLIISVSPREQWIKKLLFFLYREPVRPLAVMSPRTVRQTQWAQLTHDGSTLLCLHGRRRLRHVNKGNEVTLTEAGWKVVR